MARSLGRMVKDTPEACNMIAGLLFEDRKIEYQIFVKLFWQVPEGGMFLPNPGRGVRMVFYGRTATSRRLMQAASFGPVCHA